MSFKSLKETTSSKASRRRFVFIQRRIKPDQYLKNKCDLYETVPQSLIYSLSHMCVLGTFSNDEEATPKKMTSTKGIYILS